MRTILALLLVAPALALAQPADPSAALVPAAKKEGEVVVYTSLISEDLTALSAAFEKKYGVKVKGWRASSEKVLQRVVAEARAKRNEADVIETNGPELEALHREKVLQPLKSPYLKDLMPQALQPHGEWVGGRITMFVQAYNTKLVPKDELPRSYADLANPRWKGRLGIEAEDDDWFAMVVRSLGEEKGLAIFREIAKNGFSVRKGHTLLANLVASGEVPFSLTTYSHGAEKMKQRGAPVEWYAIEPAIGRANGVAVMKSPAHPNAAVLFVDFILSPEGQKILEKGGYLPANLRLDNPSQKLPLKFVDPAVVLDESDKWRKLWAEIVLAAPK